LQPSRKALPRPAQDGGHAAPIGLHPGGGGSWKRPPWMAPRSWHRA
jgi:hypothetical protein